FVGLDAVRMIWGQSFHTVAEPALLAVNFALLDQTYPAHRIFIIGARLLTAVLLYLGLERTPLCPIVRAGVEQREGAASLGIHIDLAFFVVFRLGIYLAGVAGVVAAPLVTVYPGMDMSVLILALIVVVVGGPGNLKGAVVGSLLIGMADTFGVVLLPEFSSFLIYFIMAAVLLFRPHGLMPAKAFS